MQKSKTTLVIEKYYNLIDVKYGNFEIYCIRWNGGLKDFSLIFYLF